MYGNVIVIISLSFVLICSYESNAQSSISSLVELIENSKKINRKNYFDYKVYKVKERELDEEFDWKLEGYVDSAATVNIEGEDGLVNSNGKVFEKSSDSVSPISSYGLKFRYKVYDGEEKENNVKFFRARSKAQLYYYKETKMIQVREYIALAVEWAKLKKVNSLYLLKKNELKKLRKRYYTLYRNKIAPKTDYEIIDDRISYFVLEIKRNKYKQDRILSKLGSVERKFLVTDKNIIPEMQNMISMKDRPKLKCNSNILNFNYHKELDKSYIFSDKRRLAESRARLNFYSDLSRQHNGFQEDGIQTDLRVGVRFVMPFFENSRNRAVDRTTELRRRKIQKDLKFAESKARTDELLYREKIEYLFEQNSYLVDEIERIKKMNVLRTVLIRGKFVKIESYLMVYHSLFERERERILADWEIVKLRIMGEKACRNVRRKNV